MFAVGSALHGGCKDGIAVVDVAYKDVLVAMAGCNWEASCEVGGNFMARFGDGGVDHVGAEIGCVCWGRHVLVIVIGGGRLRRTDVLALLVEVAFESWD